MPPIAKFLFLGAALLAVLGLIAWLLTAARIPLGHLPGDIRVERPGFRFYFPLGTGLLVSLLLSAALAVWAWLRNR